MIDLNYHKKKQPEKIEPEEIAIAIFALAMWIPMAFIFGSLL